MIIYADMLFIENLAGAYALLYILGKVIHLKMCYPKMFFGACVGAFAALIQFIYGVKLHIFGMIAMYFISYGVKNRGTLRNLAVFFAIFIMSEFTAERICSLYGFGIIKNGTAYFYADIKTFFTALAVSYALTFSVMKISRRKKKKQLHRLNIVKNKKSVEVTAIFDSGNLLKEPISGMNVIVADEFAVKKLLSDDVKIDGIRLVPYKTISGQGIMKAFLADEVTIDNCETKRFYIGMSPVKLSSENEYNALIGI